MEVIEEKVESGGKEIEDETEGEERIDQSDRPGRGPAAKPCASEGREEDISDKAKANERRPRRTKRPPKITR